MNPSVGKPIRIDSFFPQVRMRRGLVFGVIIITALLAFEFFNYSTTDYALRDLLGDLEFMGIAWATILAVAFCGIDFAGIAVAGRPPSRCRSPRRSRTSRSSAPDRWRSCRRRRRSSLRNRRSRYHP